MSRVKRTDARLSADEFQLLLEETIRELPEPFGQLIENVVITVEDEPAPADVAHHAGEPGYELLGIFRGVPRTRAVHNALPSLPNHIAIFRGPILRTTRTRSEASAQIRDTIVHELGHYFGLGDADMPY